MMARLPKWLKQGRTYERDGKVWVDITILWWHPHFWRELWETGLNYYAALGYSRASVLVRLMVMVRVTLFIARFVLRHYFR